jgi:catechol 2,3-dioxygenase-like lactoylglutathione lyase family enzyme
MTSFYRDILGLKVLTDDPKWKDFDVGGGMRLALHEGEPDAGKTKIAFFTEDVAKARATLIERGAKMKNVISGAGLALCDGTDPDGNVFQISNRG